jgi:NAD(P)-dependent dehydrogenase (short-subunit alcohol dehydrogenase family)
VLVENAGVFLVPHDRTQEGFETIVGTNYFGMSFDLQSNVNSRIAWTCISIFEAS